MVLKIARDKPGFRNTRDLIELAGYGAPVPADTPYVSPAIRRINRAASWGIAILSAAGAVSLFVSDFVPAPPTVRVAKLAALLFGSFYGIFFVGIGRFGWDEENPKIQAAIRQSPKLSKVYLRVPLMTAVFAGFAWMSFSSGLPWALNAVIGSRGTMTVTVSGWEDASYSLHGGYACARPTFRGIPFGMMGRHAVCIGDRSKSDFPPGTSLVLIGRVSPLGIAPDHYRVLPGDSGS